MPDIWTLEITSFTSIGSIGASHFYGKLSTRDGLLTGDVQCILTDRAAAKLTRKERSFVYEAGWSSNRFDSPEDVIAAAVAIFDDLATPEDILLRSGVRHRLADRPAQVLAAPAQARAVLDEIYTRWHEIDAALQAGYKRHKVDREAEARGDAASEQWAETMRSLGFIETQRTTFGFGDGSQQFTRAVVYALDGSIERVVEHGDY